ncbi:LOW QUALITY PROTEIN: chemerin-like receptor 1 [Stegostoma tigrinum]|uniref:LOW QUALITY PROTEIN: chemerin-like receptor 1 n=1 Tax=Stegostoma tigrinum TaxID=3053191 RepID=UPI00287059CD|nr:LOW QUALITY PROTEIN: chemerin-like receptor 1 [Stegostoma tigrinum]
MQSHGNVPANGSGGPVDPSWAKGVSRAAGAVTAVIFSVTFALGVLGNGLVIWVTVFRMKWSVNKVWYLSLALADFPFALLLPFSAAYAALGTHWPFGRLMCQLTSGLSVLTMFASVLMLAAISVDRCSVVLFPAWSRNRRGPRLASAVSAAVWLASVAFSAPSFVYRDTVEEGNCTVCLTLFASAAEEQAALEAAEGDDQAAALDALEASRFRSLSLARVLGGIVFPSVVIGASYVTLCLRLRRHRLVTRPGGRKPFRLLAAMVAAFLVCWLPYHALLLAELLQPAGQPLPLALSLSIPLASGLAAFNSCVNPLLYAYMGRDFQRGVGRSLPRILENALAEDSMPSARTRSSLLGEAGSTLV